MSIRKSIAAASIAFVLAPWPAIALDPKARITQYRHTAWRAHEGAFESAPNAITQTGDGYIWIGTNSSGLVKYDGVRFVPWEPPPGKSLVSSTIYSLRSSSDGTLWIGTAAGLMSWKDNKLEEHVRGRINSILEDRRHRIWVARSRLPNLSDGALCQVVGEHPGCMGGDDKMMLPTATALAEDLHGNLWVGGANQLLRLNDGSFEGYFRKQLKAIEGLTAVDSVAAGADGSIWAAIPVKGMGLQQIVDGLPRKIAPDGIDTEHITVVFMDRDRALWMGTINDGIYRIYGERVDHFRSEDGLSGNSVNSFYQDREGNLWLATSKGLDCFRDSRVLTFSTGEGLTSDSAASVLATEDGGVWIGNGQRLDLLHGDVSHGDKLTSIRIPGEGVTALWQDHASRLWVGVDKLLTVYDHGRFRKINRPDGSPLGIAVAITEDRDRNIWVSVATDRKLFRIRDLRVQEEFTSGQIPYARVLAADPASGIWLGLSTGNLAHYRNGKLETVALPPGFRPQGLTVDPDGSVWASTGGGVIHWNNGRFKILTSKNGLPCDGIFSAIRDNQGTLWLYARCGLMRLPIQNSNRGGSNRTERCNSRFSTFSTAQCLAPAHFNRR